MTDRTAFPIFVINPFYVLAEKKPPKNLGKNFLMKFSHPTDLVKAKWLVRFAYYITNSYLPLGKLQFPVIPVILIS
ncbi:hypothetical protein ApAK_08150 [Thermoplasmatales archaeon AK]|nr:hypothetical protein [Thermoplasmatales archaeon AK]